MKISTGIAEINFINRSDAVLRSEKIYVWPVYGDGRVERIQGVARRTEGNAIYSKPLPEEREKLLGLVDASRSYHYTENGRTRAMTALPPGSFFDAIV